MKSKKLVVMLAVLAAMLGGQSVLAAEPADVKAELYKRAPTCSYEAPEVYGNNILTVAEANGYTLFAQLVRVGKAQDLLTGQNGWTAFAPTNAAIQALPQDVLTRATTDQGFARQIVLYHLIQDPHMANALPQGAVRTALGKNVTIAGQTIDGNGSIVQPNLEAGNGMIHGISKVLVPPAGEFTTRNRPAAPQKQYTPEECSCLQDLIEAEQSRTSEAMANAPMEVIDSLGGIQYTVKAGDSLSLIALEKYGDSSKWKMIYDANTHVISNYNQLQIGMVLTLP